MACQTLKSAQHLRDSYNYGLSINFFFRKYAKIKEPFNELLAMSLKMNMHVKFAKQSLQILQFNHELHFSSLATNKTDSLQEYWN